MNAPGLTDIVDGLCSKVRDLHAGLSTPEPTCKPKKTKLQSLVLAYTTAAASANTAAEALAAELGLSRAADAAADAVRQLEWLEEVASEELPDACSNEQSLDDQLFEFTGLSVEMDALRHCQKQRAEARARDAAHEALVKIARIQGDFHKQLAQAARTPISPAPTLPTHPPTIDLLGDLASAQDSGVVTGSTTDLLPDLLLDDSELLPPVTPSKDDELLPSCADFSSEPVGKVASPAAATDAGPASGMTVTPDATALEEAGEGREDDSAIEMRVECWRQGKQLRALLASLHDVAPPAAAWHARSLGELLDGRAVKLAYRDALLAFHPDKLPSHKVLGQSVINALVAASKQEKR
eukprot:gb/GFBE01058156.1/.p1 GENE.gb/GFBE01058156.1/~~gb/GFBE01058156.1/.p1  ORF type:complete len:353 (+),score=73.39 gb/GFBE01058156.1/:1-1059(+)